TIPHPEYPELQFEYEERAGVLDEPQWLWIPFVAPEIRVGHALSERLTVHAGVAAWFLLAPSYPRTGGLFGDPESRWLSLPEPTERYRLAGREGSPIVKPGTVALPRENMLGPFFVLSPSISARWSF
ncbi:MAG TPA: hypothetical protein VIM73_06365, partial [Polyangiaceae bacterium]